MVSVDRPEVAAVRSTPVTVAPSDVVVVPAVAAGMAETHFRSLDTAAGTVVNALCGSAGGATAQRAGRRQWQWQRRSGGGR